MRMKSFSNVALLDSDGSQTVASTCLLLTNRPVNYIDATDSLNERMAGVQEQDGMGLFDNHRDTLNQALQAVRSRGYWSAYPEIPSRKIYGETANEPVNDKASEAFSFAGGALSVDLTGGVFVNQSAPFSDYHATGANPAGTACFADAAFVADGFHIARYAGPWWPHPSRSTYNKNKNIRQFIQEETDEITLDAQVHARRQCDQLWLFPWRARSGHHQDWLSPVRHGPVFFSGRTRGQNAPDLCRPD
jgi:hypothetical protein